MNAFDEIQEILDKNNKTWHDISFVNILYDDGFDFSDLFDLHPDHKICDIEWLQRWLKGLNYNNDFGRQLLFGQIMFKDSSWLERREYDGSEWWELREIPKYNPYDK